MGPAAHVPHLKKQPAETSMILQAATEVLLEHVSEKKETGG